MRLPELAVILALVFWNTTSLADERTDLHLFKYGRTNTEALEAAFLDFRDLLTEKLPNLSAELTQQHAIPALSALKLKSVIDDHGVLLRSEERVASLADKRRYWLQTGALSVLTGYVRQQGEVPYVYTTFYWGDLKGPHPSEMIKLELPVDGKSFDSTYDSHSVAIIYALAHALKKNCTNVADTVDLLNEAHKRAKAVTNDSPALGAELEKIVVDAIEAIRSSCSD